MSNDQPHFLARKFQDFQRGSTSYVCPLCKDEPRFSSEQKLYDHRKATHSATELSRDSNEWKDYRAGALKKAKPKHGRKLAPDPTPAHAKPASDDSMRINVGDNHHSPSPSHRPVSTQSHLRSADKKIEDLTKLSLNPESDFTGPPGHRTPSPASNPRKRSAVGETGLTDPPTESGDGHHLPRNRRAKALSGGSFVPRDPAFDRKVTMSRDSEAINERSGSHKYLYDPGMDRPTRGSNTRGFGKSERALGPRRVYDSRSHMFHSQKGQPDDFGHGSKPSSRLFQPSAVDMSSVNNGLRAEPPPSEDHSVDQGDSENSDTDPELLLQPETRPISNEQLAVEVKGIYAGLVMVETKCVDVDDKQSKAAQEKDPSRQTTLSPEQLQALSALHKTLLHEHHDFLLASQHPSASLALNRLAIKYNMPARMWRHGIHAFLEVLRYRLPASLDHMLAYIYIAYSMMALLYETVPTFEDTWIECLGDLGRYRMAIEDDDIRDREVWSGVSRFWYGKAADKNPQIGRLYHHLAILARPFTLQQLSLYTRSLTCIVPFESAKGSIMTLFNPILEGRESAYHRSSSMETIFIKAHGILFTGGNMSDFVICVDQLTSGLIDSYIARVSSKFKEQGVFAALSNISSLFEYGFLRAKGASRSTLRVAYKEVLSQSEILVPDHNNDIIESLSSPQAASQPSEPMTPQEQELSLQTIAYASDITFGTLSVALRRIGDKNVYPLVHVYLVLINSMIGIEQAIVILENRVPWTELALFLTSLFKTGSTTRKSLGVGFPKPDEGIGRPLPEDFLMRGQPWSVGLFPYTWFSDAAVDDEERALELPSMTAPRIERMSWLGHRIALCKKWLLYDESSRAFSVSQYVRDFPTQDVERAKHPASSLQDQDSIMSGLDDEEDTSIHMPNSPLRRQPSVDSSMSDLKLGQLNVDDQGSLKSSSPTKAHTMVPRKILTKEDTKPVGFGIVKREVSHSPPLNTIDAHSEEWLKGEDVTRRPQPHKLEGSYPSDRHKLDLVNLFETSEEKDPTKV